MRPLAILTLVSLLVLGCDKASSLATGPDEAPKVPGALMDDGATSWSWERASWSKIDSLRMTHTGVLQSGSRSLLEVRLRERKAGDTTRLVVAVAESVWTWGSHHHIDWPSLVDSLVWTQDTTEAERRWTDTLFLDQVAGQAWSATGDSIWRGILHGQRTPAPLHDTITVGLRGCSDTAGPPVESKESSFDCGQAIWRGEPGVGTAEWRLARHAYQWMGGVPMGLRTKQGESLRLRGWSRP